MPPAVPSHQAFPAPAACHPNPPSFTALCGGVDTRGWAAAAGDEGVRGDPLIESPFRVWG